MSENVVETSEATTEKEIIIDLDDQTDKDPNGSATEGLKNSPKGVDISVMDEQKPKLATKFVDRKQIVDLTDDEKALIVANAKNGLDQPHFSVKFFKNGKYRILKKKEQAPTVSQKIISSNAESTKQPEKKVFYSDNQLLFEHIIELNSKVDRLMQKHKKLKRKYQALQNDIYVDDDEEVVHEQNIDEEREKPSVEIKNNEPQPEREREPQPQPERAFSPELREPQPQRNVYVRQSRASWRNNITYL